MASITHNIGLSADLLIVPTIVLTNNQSNVSLFGFIAFKELSSNCLKKGLQTCII